jgi:L-fuconolactonase
MIDSHHHLWDLSVRAQPWLTGDQLWASSEQLAPLRRSFTVDDLLSQALPAGVDGTVVVQVLADPAETADMLALAGRGGLVSAVVGWADLAAPDVEEQIAAYRSLPGGGRLAGVRHPLLAEPDPYWLGHASVRRGLRALASAGLCFDLTLFARQLPMAVAAARAVPSLMFVLDHLGNPAVTAGAHGTDGAGGVDGGVGGGGAGWGGVDAGWAAAIGDLGRLDNVVCKLSGAHTSPPSALALRPWFSTVLAAFGPDRLMFGSDWPVSSLVAPYGEIAAVYRSLISALSPGEQHAILDGTARRVYQLGA